MNDQVNHQGETVIPTESTTKTPFATTGFFAALSSVLCVRGAGAPKTRHAPAALLGLVAACVVLALSAAPASAALPTEFGSEGSGAGQMLVPTGIAANNDSSSLSYGDVYVLDRVNNRVNEFTSEGVFIRAWGWGVNPQEDNPVTGKPEEKLQICTTATGCQKGSSGAGPGQFHEPKELGGIAVDSNGAPDSSSGDVYVLDRENERVEKFTAEGAYITQFPVGSGAFSVAVGPTGAVYVGEREAVQEYGSEGKVGTTLALLGAGAVSDLAVNAAGEIYTIEEFASEGQTIPVRHYNAAGKPVGEVAECGDVPGELDCEAEGHALSLALDAAGDVFINHFLARREVHGAKVEPRQIRAFTPAGVQLSVFATAENGVREGLAFDDQTGALYTPAGAGGNRVHVYVQPPPGPEVSRESAGGVEPTAAVVHATIGPDAPVSCGETHYRVEYATAKEFAETGKYGKTAPAAEGELPRSFEEVEVPGVPLTGLSTRTTYHYRFVASDECELEPIAHKGVKTTFTTDGEDANFTTEPPALIEEESATEVRSTSATLHATINPFGVATEYRFVYGPCAGGGECSIPVRAEQLGSAKTEVEQHLQGLTAGQAYHYRVITTNTIAGKEEVEEGEERAFTTQTGGEAGLPDNRQWELVSPPDKHGASLLGTTRKQFIQAAASGGGIAYLASAPTEGQPQGNGADMQILAHRDGSAWSSLDLEVPHTFPVGVTENVPYVAFSPDLGLAVLQPLGSFEPALSSEATEQTAYLRDDTTDLFTPLVIGCTSEGVCHPNRNDTTEPFIPFGEEGTEGQCREVVCGPDFRGASPDLSHVVLGSGNNANNVVPPPLLQGTPAESLYEWGGGKLALVSELPKSNPPEVNGLPTLGGVSGVGSSVTARAVSSDGSRVFWSENEAHGEAPFLFMRDMTLGETIEIGGVGAKFEGANEAGTLVFYSGKECEVPVAAAGLECKPVREAGGEPVEDGQMLATSEDGSWVYFRQGESIFVRHGSGPARLLASATGNIRPESLESPNEHGTLVPREDPWRASPNGEWFAFMSDSPLTGYDNHDALTGSPDEEVYLYSAAAGRLVCASCEPTGARPRGTTTTHLNLAAYAEGWPEQSGIAATVPGWAPYNTEKTVYDPRFLSDSGRLFFNAVDALVPKDVNEQVDTYELEPPGVGGCTASTQTGTVVYSPAAAGCVALISSGESSEESVFEDASESGEDVFFLSSSRLSTADQDGTVSMWDAHECTTSSPCIPAPASPPLPCNTESSCKASPSSQPTIYQAPASATFNGPGNVAPAPPGPKIETRAQKLTRALAQCHKDRAKKKRVSCEKSAKKKYGAVKKTKKAKKSSHNGRASR
jgi:hypothetical protein